MTHWIDRMSPKESNRISIKQSQNDKWTTYLRPENYVNKSYTRFYDSYNINAYKF